MRQKIKIPRILKINWINKLTISLVFNNGESRIIDFKEVLKKTEVKVNSPAAILFNAEEFSKVELAGNTLSWSNVEQYITMRDGERKQAPFEIGADTLFEYSQTEERESDVKIGKMIRKARIESGLTQQALALKSGTTRTYISRIENNHSDLEIATLRKIIEIGLGKQLNISIK